MGTWLKRITPILIVDEIEPCIPFWEAVGFDRGAEVPHGDKLGFMSRRVNGDLERFRHFIQERATPTGSYRETLENPKAPGGFTSGRPGSDLH